MILFSIAYFRRRAFKIATKNLLRQHNNDIALQLSGSILEPFLCIGLKIDVSQGRTGMPLEKMTLNSFRITSGWVLSKPVDLPFLNI